MKVVEGGSIEELWEGNLHRLLFITLGVKSLVSDRFAGITVILFSVDC